MAKEAARRNRYRLLRAIRDAAPEDKKRLVAELHKAVTVEFEAEQAEREYRLEQLAKEIARARVEVKTRETQREKIISERVERLMEMSSRIGRGWPKSKPKSKPKGKPDKGKPDKGKPDKGKPDKDRKSPPRPE